MSYKTELQGNNADLQAILDTVKALPETSGGGVEPIPVTADNIEEYFEVNCVNFEPYSDATRFIYSVYGGETEGYEDENGDWVDGEWIDHGFMTLKSLKDMTFFIQYSLEISAVGSYCGFLKNTHIVFDTVTGDNGVVLQFPLCLEVKEGDIYEISVDLLEEGDHAGIGYMSVIPK